MSMRIMRLYAVLKGEAVLAGEYHTSYSANDAAYRLARSNGIEGAFITFMTLDETQAVSEARVDCSTVVFGDFPSSIVPEPTESYF